MTSQPSKAPFLSAALGTVAVALCCFTPLLVSLLGALGLGMLTSYLDVVLLPALVVLALITITVLAYRKWQRAQEAQDRQR